MRIVGGTARGRVLASPQDAETIRPTADRVRQAVFNVLGQTCDGLHVLDLFCGTGALAFEALSRGAMNAVLVDSGKEALQLARLNAKSLRFEAQVEIQALPVERALERLKGRGFELVFSDPPYKQKAALWVLSKLETVMSEGGVAVIEHGKSEEVPNAVGRMRREDARSFGETVVSIFRLTGSVP